MPGCWADTAPVRNKVMMAAVPPTVTVSDFADGTGADIFLNGELVAKVTGAQGLLATSVIVEAFVDTPA